jgi:uncharacterized protein
MRLRFMLLAVLAVGQQTSAIAQPVIQAVPERPRIIVDGYGEVRTPPDVATISYAARGEGPTSDVAVRSMAATEARIRTALRGLDPNADPRTGDVRVSPVKSADCKESQDETLQLSAGSCSVVGYIATQSLTLRTAKVKDAGTMVGLAGRAGSVDAKISSFDLNDPKAVQRQATAAALADAASKALAIATASHVSLGPILNINTSSRENDQEIVVTGADMREARANMISPAPVHVEANPEPITTRANVTVTYAIGQ